MSGEQNEHFSQEDVGDKKIQWNGKPAKESQIIPVMFGIILISFGLGLLVLLGVYVRVKCTTYAVTDKGLYKKRGVLSEKTRQ